ncbi:phosphotransferase [Corynebacterium sp. 4HC-13]|uniref:Phosphotransferase n=2 Tax=Corynebacterium anserum TaxID=2684406 RepID=A0A7G7YMT6_9CORY|nr:fructosamine kinase family protein [Corynebacterium anserum]MBC2681184.1 phosphotransferase [Corynebacterium anserum]QNH95806.1 phosphotransferase [Corynebacterium anserum]
MVSSYVKNNPGRTGEWEVAGLRWLRSVADGTGLHVAKVLAATQGAIHLERIEVVQPSAKDAEEFGRSLARFHRVDVGKFGQGPRGWQGDGYQGPTDQLLVLPLHPTDSWGCFYAEVLEGLAAGQFGQEDRRDVDELLARLRGGDFDAQARPSALHGDMWAGNVLWSRHGAVLIDPMAHVGHPETDLGALQLFGAPHIGSIIGAYVEEAGLDHGFVQRTPLHQLHLLFLHVALFGGSYRIQAMDAVRASLRL